MINGATWNGIGRPRRPGPGDRTTQLATKYEIFEHGCSCGFRVKHVFLTRVLMVPPDSRTWSFQLSDAVKHLDR